MVLVLIIGDRLNPEILVREDYLQMNRFSWFIMLYIVMVNQRIPYYVVWIFGQLYNF